MSKLHIKKKISIKSWSNDKPTDKSNEKSTDIDSKVTVEDITENPDLKENHPKQLKVLFGLNYL